MAELATIARPYAEALFKASSKDLQGAAGWLDQLAAIAANDQLLAFAANPKVPDDQVIDLTAGLVPQPLPEAGRNFLRAIIENGRLTALPEVAAQFRLLCNARAGAFDAMVYSAFPIDDAALKDVGAALEKRFGRKLKLRLEIDETLIGGIRAVVGDEVLDTSVRARLDQMKAALTA
ncbi:F0F1 ATP synthase subunit delta [Variovorax paradoxus]|uniref:ATP synthase subunit delta n=1 Tax=Variovorax paradoxus (strain EPS) TaxID=595537 RepID=E6VAC2_VARPE|nr:F0F1 ATP synthase subunit delta [Variovorax paradoxus]ADU39666.1 ATP synthase F1, delta subunit [Variovorax paradoxus EPS]